MRLIKESKIKGAIRNPGNWMCATGCGYYLFTNVHRLWFQSALAPQRHHLTGTNWQRHILGARLADVAKWQRKCDGGNPRAFPRLCHRHQIHEAGVSSHRNRRGENLIASRGFLKINVQHRWTPGCLWAERALNVTRKGVKGGAMDGERINSAIPVMNVCIRRER